MRISDWSSDVCSSDLVFEKVVQDFDCSVIEGHRDQAAQDKAFAEGHSKLKWPHGNHNALPSRAVDVAPYPIDWTDSPRMHLFAGYVIATALSLGIKLRWGGDRDGDRQVKDEDRQSVV